MSEHIQHEIADRSRSLGRFGRLGALATAGIMALGSMIIPTGVAAADPSAADWAKVRNCESGGNYSINTGNGYYGAYQFNWGTWQSVGGTGNPAHASRAEQDYRALILYRMRGWQPWTCARKVGLYNDKDGGSGVMPTRAEAEYISGPPPAPAKPVPPHPKLSKAEATSWVNHTYATALGSKGGNASSYIAALQAGTTSKEKVATAIYGSETFTKKVVHAAYVACLGRKADSIGLNRYTAQLRNGSLTFTNLYADLCSKTEAYNNADRNRTTWVKNTYRALYGFAASPTAVEKILSIAKSKGIAAASRFMVDRDEWRAVWVQKMFGEQIGQKANAAQLSKYIPLVKGDGHVNVRVELSKSAAFKAKALKLN